MVIKRLVLKRYNRFTLNNIREFIYRPTASNLIIGSNGSGKSSLMGQLSPLSVNKNDFNHGYKEIEIEHRGSTFILTFDDGKYSFLKDGVELNDSGTVKRYNALVQEYFGLTQGIFDVMTNKRLFTEMSPNERKDWFTMISPMDYDYLLKVFQNAKVKLRDLQGGLKIISSRAVSIERGLLSKEEVELLEKEKSVLETLIDEFNRLIAPVNSETKVTDLKALKAKYDLIKDQLVPIVSLDQKTEMLKYTHKQIEDIMRAIDKLEEVTKQSGIDQEITTLKEQVKTFNYLDVEDISIIESLLYDNDDFRNLIDHVMETSYSMEDYTKATNEYNQLVNMIDVLNREYNRLDAIKTEQENASKKDEVTCPKCTHTFKAGYDPKTLEESKEKLFTLKEKIETYKKQLSEAENRKNAIETYFNYTKRLKDLLNNTPKLKTFLYSDSFSITYPNLLSSIEDTKQYQKIQKRLEQLSHMKQGMDDAIHELQQKQLEEKEELEFKLSILNRRVFRLNREIKEIKKQLSLRDTLKELSKAIKEGIDSLTDHISNERLKIENRYFENAIQKARVLLKEKETTLNNYRNEEYLYKKTKKEMEELEADITAAKELVDALSPNKGLIGMTLSGFLKDFTDAVNQIISKVWTYEMKVLPPDLSDGQLDYKFRVIANGEERRDIVDTSTGMAEMINLAFKLVSMRYLGMDDYPIYLDEFAASFDIEHKRKSLTLLNELKQTYPQMFVISHYENIVSLDADAIVLDEDNVNLSIFNRYNENVKIK